MCVQSKGGKERGRREVSRRVDDTSFIHSAPCLLTHLHTKRADYRPDASRDNSDERPHAMQASKPSHVADRTVENDDGAEEAGGPKGKAESEFIRSREQHRNPHYVAAKRNMRGGRRKKEGTHAWGGDTDETMITCAVRTSEEESHVYGSGGRAPHNARRARKTLTRGRRNHRQDRRARLSLSCASYSSSQDSSRSASPDAR